MKINPEIYDKARTLLNKREEEEEYRDTCIKANICFVCGEKLEKYKVKTGKYEFRHGIRCTYNTNHFDDYFLHDTYISD